MHNNVSDKFHTIMSEQHHKKSVSLCRKNIREERVEVEVASSSGMRHNHTQ